MTPNLGGAAIAHDAKGNLTSEGGRSFGYSSENLLTGFSNASFTHNFRYDPLMRLRQIETPNIVRRHYVRDGDDLVLEYNDNTLVARYVHGPGDDEPLYGYRASDGRRYWYHADERGTPVAVSLADGSLWTRAVHDEYGRGSGSVTFHFTGKQVPSGVAGILYSNARMYDPRLGRFLQLDPIGYGDGMNLYAYVRADPVNLVDPSGNCAEIVASRGTCGARGTAKVANQKDDPDGNTELVNGPLAGGQCSGCISGDHPDSQRSIDYWGGYYLNGQWVSTRSSFGVFTFGGDASLTFIAGGGVGGGLYLNTNDWSLGVYGEGKAGLGLDVGAGLTAGWAADIGNLNGVDYSGGVGVPGFQGSADWDASGLQSVQGSLGARFPSFFWGYNATTAKCLINCSARVPAFSNNTGAP